MSLRDPANGRERAFGRIRSRRDDVALLRVALVIVGTEVHVELHSHLVFSWQEAISVPYFIRLQDVGHDLRYWPVVAGFVGLLGSVLPEVLVDPCHM